MKIKMTNSRAEPDFIVFIKMWRSKSIKNNHFEKGFPGDDCPKDAHFHKRQLALPEFLWEQFVGCKAAQLRRQVYSHL